MYAFKVCVSTLMVLWILLMLIGGLKAKGSGKTVAMIGFVVSMLSLVAIWG